ncbi:hypothetical protein Bca52824_089367 [Brassica carinata]|uniref:Uncharacterized protein n=1 Tax=Brassica carinata TaxID=52824 RepID=A0A8X7PC07_BRACI|nr:hypothetical protein Bca52824_089367 [Brassica carinata]
MILFQLPYRPEIFAQDVSYPGGRSLMFPRIFAQALQLDKLSSSSSPLKLKSQSNQTTPSSLQIRRIGEKKKMAVTMKHMSLIVSLFGVLSFILGVIAENKKPASGTPINGKGVVICKYPSDPTVALGYLSAAFLLACTVAGYKSLFISYKGRSVPNSVLFKSTSFSVFFNIALITSGLALSLLLWPTITEQLHLTRNVHRNLETSCPTAKTGLLGGGAFVSLDSCLFWLVALMLADNAREDHFDEADNRDGDGNSSSRDVNLKIDA